MIGTGGSISLQFLMYFIPRDPGQSMMIVYAMVLTTMT